MYWEVPEKPDNKLYTVQKELQYFAALFVQYKETKVNSTVLKINLENLITDCYG